MQDVREMLNIPPKSECALDSGSVGLFDVAGMSEVQREVYAARRAGAT